MDKLISIGIIDKYIAYPIIDIIFIIIENTIFYNYEILNVFYSHKFLICLSKSFGKILSIIPHIILNIQNKDINNQNQILKYKYLYKKEYYNKFVKIKYKKISLIIIYSILNVINNILYYLIVVKVHLWVFDIIFFHILSYYLLNVKLYKHQYLSTLIIFILGIIINIINLYDFRPTLVNILLSVLTEIIYCLNIVISKYIMEYTFCSPYELCFIDGILSAFLFIICFVIFTYIEINNDDIILLEYEGKYYLDNFYTYFQELNLKEFFIFIIESIYHNIYHLFPLITIKHYTTCHYLFILFVEGELNTFYDEELPWRFTANLIIVIIIFLMILINDEIIELNFFGLQKNTRKNITKRAQKEVLEEIVKENEEHNQRLNSINSTNSINDDDYLMDLEENGSGTSETPEDNQKN